MTSSYLDEILQQPGMLLALSQGPDRETAEDLQDIVSRLHDDDFDRVILTGMGSSLHGSYPLYLQLSQALSVPACLVDTSELVQQAPEMVSRRSLMIATSQSGESGEIVELTKLPGMRPAATISVTNQLSNSLANWADVRLASMAGPEMTVSSKSYTGGFACLHILGAALRGGLPQAAKEIADAATACAAMLENWQPGIRDVTEFLDAQIPLMYVGRGKSLGSAQVAALLTQEAAKMSCSALSGGQFRHGPIELARDGFQMVIFLGDLKTRDIDMVLIKKITSLGGKVVAVAPKTSAPAETEGLRVYSYPDVAHPLTPLMEAIFIQLLQIPLAKARGFVAGNFINATKVTGIV
jgi:glucosamine--fructose-6-phosphate aminotransferase (isomerizing)